MDPKLQQAYQNAKYVVPNLGLTILLNHSNPDLYQMLVDHNQTKFCFITAFNPYSEVLSNNQNYVRNQELKRDIDAYLNYPGYGQDVKEEWPREDSFLVLGILKNASIDLGNKYQQNAILFGEIKDAEVVIELLILV